MRDQTKPLPEDVAAAMPTAQILPFKPRTSDSPSIRSDATGRPGMWHPGDEPNGKDAAPDEFRHRMLVNLAGLACAVALTASGIWLATRISQLRETQDCVLSGRRDCAPVTPLDRKSLPLRQH